MKKMLLVLMIGGLVSSQVQNAKAGSGFGIAAAAVGGVAVGTVIGSAIAQPSYYAPSYYAPAPAYYAAPAPYAPVAVCPAPVVVARPAYACLPVPVVRIGFGFGPCRGGFWGHGGWHRRG